MRPLPRSRFAGGFSRALVTLRNRLIIVVVAEVVRLQLWSRTGPLKSHDFSYVEPLSRKSSMRNSIPVVGRRAFLGAAGLALFTTPGVFAEELARTPPMTEGPFYPDRLPLDT